MDSLYTGDLNVNEENVFGVATAELRHLIIYRSQLLFNVMIREFLQLRFVLHNYCLLSTGADRHGLRDLQEAAEHKMTPIYVTLCGYKSEKFLSDVGADQLFSLPGREIEVCVKYRK